MACTLRIAADTRTIWSARNQSGAHAGLRRQSATAAPGRQGQRAGDPADRRHDSGRARLRDRPGQSRGAGRRADERGEKSATCSHRRRRSPLRYILDAVHHGWTCRSPTANFSRRRSSVCRFDRRHARGTRRFSRSASRASGRQVTKNLRIAIVVARFNDFVTERLLAGAQDRLRERASRTPTSRCCTCRAPSRFPMAAQRIAETGRVSAVICLGCLIRGATPHFEYIASACAHGITAAAAATGVPMAVRRAHDELGRRSARRAVAGDGTRGARPRRRRSTWRRSSTLRRRSRVMSTAPGDPGRALGGPPQGARSGAPDALSGGGRAEWLRGRRGRQPSVAVPRRFHSTIARAQFADALVRGAWTLEALDGYIGEAARNWRVERLRRVIGSSCGSPSHELMAFPGTPPRSSIDEAIELARAYSGDEATRFVERRPRRRVSEAQGRGEDRRVQSAKLRSSEFKGQRRVQKSSSSCAR